MDKVEQLQVLKKLFVGSILFLPTSQKTRSRFCCCPQLVPNPLFMMKVLEQIFVQQEVRLYTLNRRQRSRSDKYSLSMFIENMNHTLQADA